MTIFELHAGTAFMKHRTLHSVAHNFADSLASGASMLVGEYDLDVFGEARKNADRTIVINYLERTIVGAEPGGKIEHALPVFFEVFPTFCEKHGVSVDDFKKYEVRFVADNITNYMIVTIEDRCGRSSIRDYFGNPAKRAQIMDHLGRRRRSNRLLRIDTNSS